MASIRNEAYVTLVTSDSYVVGAGVLAQSLRDSGTSRLIWCLATPKSLSEHSMTLLRTIFDGITEVDCIDSKDDKNLALLGRPELGPTFTKLHLWRLKQFDKVVFLDADTLALKNIDDLFEREELSACADIGWPDCFNSGVFVAVPDEKTFADLVQLAEQEGSFDGGDQGLLNSYFHDWSTGPSSRRIPFTYNLTINASYSYAPAYARFKNDVKVVHFIGKQKPWTYYRLDDGSLLSRGESANSGASLMEYLQFWWNIHDRLSLTLQTNNSLAFISYAPNSAHFSSNDVFKSYGSNGMQSATSNQKTSRSNPNDLADFAAYRIKWSADVERYFNTTKIGKGSSETGSNGQNQLENLTINGHDFLVRNSLRYQSHSKHQQQQQYRMLNDSDDLDEAFYDGRYYSDE